MTVVWLGTWHNLSAQQMGANIYIRNYIYFPESGPYIKKDPNAGKDWRQEEKGETEDEMVGWHHRLNGHEFG